MWRARRSQRRVLRSVVWGGRELDDAYPQPLFRLVMPQCVIDCVIKCLTHRAIGVSFCCATHFGGCRLE